MSSEVKGSNNEVRVISPIELGRNRQNILSQAMNGSRFVIERKGVKIAVLGPYRSTEPETRGISQEQKDKLDLVEEVSVEELRRIILLARGELSILELLMGKRK